MTSQTLPTEPLRAEHREFLRGHLVPHAQAEEQVLYPAVEDAMAAPGATATMRADHRETVARIDRLAVTVDALDPDSVDDPTRTRDVAHQLVGLSAVLQLHFAKEEEVLLPILDRTLDAEHATGLFSRMDETARG